MANVKLTKKSDDKGIDPEKIGQGKKPELSEVEGQWQYWDTYACPWCWSLNDVVVDTNMWLRYRCWACGGIFEV